MLRPQLQAIKSTVLFEALNDETTYKLYVYTDLPINAVVKATYNYPEMYIYTLHTHASLNFLSPSTTAHGLFNFFFIFFLFIN